MNTIDIKNEVIKTGKFLLDNGYVSRTWGNISCKIDDDYMAITPSGRTYDALKADDIVLLNINTGEYLGKIKPSSEFKLHLEIYKSRKDVNAIIHTHQINASTVSAARIEIPPILDDMAQIIGPSIKTAKYALPGTDELANNAVKALEGRNACLLANHGAVCIGRDLDEAYAICEILEKSCKVFIDVKNLGGAISLSEDDAKLMHEFYINDYSKKKTENI